MSASDHLNYLWLVGVEQKPVDPSWIDPRPLAHVYHLTACRSPLGQEAKMSFYTALYFGPPEKAATTAGQQRWLIASL